MADKEATVYIVDVGPSMAERHSARAVSDLDWSMTYVWNKLGTVAEADRKTLCAGVLGLRTDQTANAMQDDSGYENISVLKPLGPVLLSDIHALAGRIGPSGTSNGDAISAIVLAADMIDEYTKKQKWRRRIVLVTAADGSIDPDDTMEIVKRLDACSIELVVLGVDFDDLDYGFKEEDKPRQKAENEKLLRAMTESCREGTFATIAEAIDSIDKPNVKEPRPYKTYDGKLTLGDAQNFPSAVCIDVERYFRTHVANPPSASTVAGGNGPREGSMDTLGRESGSGGVEFQGVRNNRSYRVNDPSEPGGKREVSFEDLAKGYEYGRTAVHISESDMNITKLEEKEGFTVVGFVSKDKYEPFLNMGECGVTVAKKGDVQAQIALSSFAWALAELDSLAVARLVAKDNKDPVLVLLSPGMDGAVESLYDVPLPFAEDVRGYQFPPLDRIITVSGTTLREHRLLPGDELAEAMGEYVDAMDISSYGVGDEGEPVEYATVEESYNPTIHRLKHAIRARALYPDQPLPETPAMLLKFAAPPSDLVEKSQAEIDRLIDSADVKKVPPKAKGKRKRETAKPISGLDIDALLNSSAPSGPPGAKPKKAKITAENAIPEFKRALDAAGAVSDIEAAARQMGDIICTLIHDDFGGGGEDRALENLGCMRGELVELEEAGLYNSFARQLKGRLLSGELGSDRREMWFKIRNARLGLVDSREGGGEGVVEVEEAEKFFKTR